MKAIKNYIYFAITPIIIFGSILIRSNQVYAGTFSQEINTSTGKLYPIKNLLNQTTLCNPSYVGTSCYINSIGAGLEVGSSKTITSPSAIEAFAIDTSYTYTIIMGNIPNTLTSPSAVTDFPSDISYSYSLSGIAPIAPVLPPDGLAFDKIASPFQGISVFEKDKLTAILNMYSATSNNSRIDSILYNSGGIIPANNTVEYQFAPKTIKTTVAPTISYSVFGINIGGNKLFSKIFKDLNQ